MPIGALSRLAETALQDDERYPPDVVVPGTQLSKQLGNRMASSRRRLQTARRRFATESIFARVQSTKVPATRRSFFSLRHVVLIKLIAQPVTQTLLRKPWPAMRTGPGLKLTTHSYDGRIALIP